MKKPLKIVLSVILILATLIGLNVFGELLMPYRANYGSTWDAYLEESKNSIDVLFFGSSLVYCDVVPAAIWSETGLRSYVMAGPEQTIPITYYYVKEACKTQSPQAIAVEVTGLFYEKYQNFTKINIGYMPWSLNRLSATFNAAEPNVLADLLFPIYAYHDRIFSISPGEIKQNLIPQADPYAGYTVLYDHVAQNDISYRDYSTETKTYKENLNYLKKISDFCTARNIKLVLYVAPSFWQIPEQELQQMQSDIQSIPHCTFWNCNDGTWPEFDNSKVWYDALHYNIYGAVPFSEEFGKRLLKLDIAITDSYAELWQKRSETLQSTLATP